MRASFRRESMLPLPALSRLSAALEKAPPPDAQAPAVDLPRLMDELARIAQATGSREFYRTALAALGNLLGCPRQLAMRYAQFAPPQFLVNHSLDPAAVAVYASDLYRQDPLLHLVRKGGIGERIVTIAELYRAEPGNIYFEELNRAAGILDELVVLLPAVGGVWVALCLDLDDRPFGAGEIERVRQIYPLLERLHGLHIDCSLAGRRGGYLNDSHLAVMVLDERGTVCFRNEVWSRIVDAALEGTIRSLARDEREGVHALGEQEVVHWETLDPGHAVAPAGRIFMLERRPGGGAGTDVGRLLASLAVEFQLTPREVEIVELSLQGLGNAAIAARLNVGLGTVRNHKHRLYYKLDVTSEREIASLIFARIFRRADC